MPLPGVGQIPIGVKAAAVNPVDWQIAAGYPQAMIPQAMPLTLGCEFAGVVASAGQGWLWRWVAASLDTRA